MFFEIECLEKFKLRTSYKVKADSYQEALEKIKDGDVTDCGHEIDEWYEFVDVLDHKKVNPDEKEVSDFQ
jgi:hypothetical protein